MNRISDRLLYKHKVIAREAAVAAEEADLDDLAKEFNREKKVGEKSSARNGPKENDGDSSDEFGVFDPTKHVSFDEKLKLSE